MDTSNFDSDNINVFLARVQIDALRENKDPRKVLIRAFLGGVGGEQTGPLNRAYLRVHEAYIARGIKLVLQTFHNDMVKRTYHWTCTELFDHLIAADIHLLPTHLHQGMMALGGTDTWNILNILRNIERLRYHVGIPSGVYTGNSVGNQDKIRYLEPLERAGLCAPTLAVDLCEEISAGDFTRIHE
jgi:hypothetical protein